MTGGTNALQVLPAFMGNMVHDFLRPEETVEAKNLPY